jgi:putative restriction endonuclease
MSQQNYEEYWKFTNAFTDYNGKKFLDTLAVCVNFIDEYKDEPYSEEKYSRLQLKVKKVNPINLISIRKSINQLVKMGFINSFLLSYHSLAKEYLEAKTNKKRKTLLSKICYSNFSANKAVNVEDKTNHLNFLIKTLVEYGNFTKEQITGLMLVDLNTYKDDFVSEKDIDYYEQLAIEIDFYERKHNQVDYMWNLLGKLDELAILDSKLYFEEDAKQIFGEDLTTITKKRDPYLHRLYKNQLQEECEEIYGKPLCVLEKLAYPVLIASHIKPFIQSDDTEAYDPNNGLLLSRTIDSLFDLKYISFTDDGKMIFSKRISDDVKEFWKDYQLEPTILNDKRKNYLAYHRNLMTTTDKMLN